MGSMPFDVALTDGQFTRISDLVKRQCGINLHVGKKQLVKARLNKRLRTLGLSDFQQYLHYLEEDREGNELVTMLDALSTNLTSFFREIAHFDYLREVLVQRWLNERPPRQRLRLWSAGCSTGEEPYSLIIALKETMDDIEGRDTRILATDLSTRVLASAARGVYPASRLHDLSQARLQRHFQPAGEIDGERGWCVRPELRRHVSFARLNLMEGWPMHGPFDVIFCRNVMIYFDKPTQESLVQRFVEMLAVGGTLFVGHSESLAGVRHDLKYIRPTIYERR